MAERFPELPASPLALEEEILERWKTENTFALSLEQTSGGEPFVFYEGPPTANGRPGIHHVLSRTIKDAVARFRTMQGRYVPRTAGWDTHGLPVEIEAEKRLGISGKRDIEQVGIARFNEVCRESVLQYTDDWERFSGRIGYWLDYANPYVTFHPEYIEGVWALLSEIAARDLIYRGHKILPYCPRCGTGLSSHEVALGYKDVRDPSLYLSMPVLGEDGTPDGREFLVWTTTPWTLVSNVALAVHPELRYVEVENEGRRYILAEGRVNALFGDDASVAREVPASELIGLRYRRPFEWVEADEGEERAWRVVPAGWVSAEEGTGIVHMSPAFGADDYATGREHGLPMLIPVDDRGAFRADLPLVGGQFVKDADEALLRDLKARGQVFRATREEHSYPHCWRCGSPLLYMARDSWFIRTTAVRDELLAANAEIHWYPPEVGSGRFGEWLENNIDWALSRNRYWGTPLPAWICDADPEHIQWISSLAELAEAAGGLPDGFDPHRPWIDEVTWGCESCGGTMRRTPEVIDVWFDSGAMPFAAKQLFPADFICEGVDQTRGWFYSLLAISVLMGRGPAYRNVIVNDLVLDPEGQKMSKSRGNVVEPWAAIERFGADAIRWYLLTGSHPWLPKRFDPEGVREVQRLFDTLRNTYRFFAMYANLEDWRADGDPGRATVLDRWLASRVASTVIAVNEALEAYNLTHAVRTIGEFISDDLSNWYVRRSRDRFWGSEDPADSRAAFAALHNALVQVTRLMAPFAPFFADWIHRATEDGSVHLATFPAPDQSAQHAQLERGMDAVRRLSTLGRAAREEAGVRVRQPLGTLYAVIPADTQVDTDLLEILRDELNVRRVEFMDRAEDLVTFSARPNFKALGKKHGKRTPAVADAIRALASDALARFRRGEPLSLSLDGESVPLEGEDLDIIQGALGDLVVASDAGFTVALDPSITPELRAEGIARELVNRIQRFRKDADLHVADRITATVGGEPELLESVRTHREFIAGETLALDLRIEDVETAAARAVDLDGVAGWVRIERVTR